MSKRPERIRIFSDGYDSFWCDSSETSLLDEPEYIRADIADAHIEAARRKGREIDHREIKRLRNLLEVALETGKWNSEGRALLMAAMEKE